MTFKICSKCGVQQLLANFYKEKSARDGYRNDCKSCFAARSAARYREDPDRVKHRVKQWQQDNADRLNEYRREYRQRPERKAADREGHLKRKFGITQEQYEEMLAVQHGGCAICSDPPEAGKALHVDHDHDTADVRALLCVRCNNGLGQFKEDPILLDRARTYLQTADDEEVAEMVRLTKERVRQLIAAR